MTAPIYLDYNATPHPSPLEVVREMLPFLQLHFGNPSSSSILGRRNKEAIEKARMQVAGLTGAKPEEILFTSGGTESNNHAIRGAVFANSEKGKHIITSQTEHPAVIEVCKFLEKQGFKYPSSGRFSFGSKSEDVEKNNQARNGSGFHYARQQ